MLELEDVLTTIKVCRVYRDTTKMCTSYIVGLLASCAGNQLETV